MIKSNEFYYKPSIEEYENATSSYLMSFVALIAGLPLPIFNLIATLIFYLSNRKSSLFVRWHCFQTLLSQIFIFLFNSVGFFWTIQIIFFDFRLTNLYISYIIVIILLNLVEYITTIIISIRLGKYKHYEWWLISDFVNYILKDEIEKINN